MVYNHFRARLPDEIIGKASEKDQRRGVGDDIRQSGDGQSNVAQDGGQFELERKEPSKSKPEEIREKAEGLAGLVSSGAVLANKTMQFVGALQQFPTLWLESTPCQNR